MVFPGDSSTSISVTRGRDPRDERFKADLEVLLGDAIEGGGVIQQLGDTFSRLTDDLQIGKIDSI